MIENISRGRRCHHCENGRKECRVVFEIDLDHPTTLVTPQEIADACLKYCINCPCYEEGRDNLDCRKKRRQAAECENYKPEDKNIWYPVERDFIEDSDHI